MEWATKLVSFSINNITYWKIDKITIGSPLSPVIANVFVGFLEQQPFDKVPKPYCYVLYIDDTFACFSSHNEALKLYQYLNNLHPSLSFTMEEENKNMLHYIYIYIYIYVWLNNKYTLCLYNFIKILSSFLISVLVSGWIHLKTHSIPKSKFEKF